MKRTVFAALLMTAFAAFLFANEIGVGYNHGGPTCRFKWDDAITSELSMVIDYNNDALSDKAETLITLALAPVNLALYRGELGAVSIGFVFKDRIVYRAGKGEGSTTEFTANDFSLDVLLPEMELNFPGVDGLKIIGALGVGASWGYSPQGKLDSFSMNLFGISLANVGLVYYFNLGGTQGAAALPAATVPAAVPTAVPAAVPAKEKPAQ